MTADQVRKLIRAEIDRLDGRQASLAKRLRVSQQYISSLLSGVREIPTRGPLLDYLGIEATVTWKLKRR